MRNHSDKAFDFGPSVEQRIFRERLLSRMRELNMRAADVARAAKLSKDALSTYTTMRSLPTPETLARLAKALKCKPSFLFPRNGKDNYLPFDLKCELVELAEEHIGTFPRYPRNYRVLVTRVPLPMSVAFRLIEQLQPYLERSKESSEESSARRGA